MIKSLPYLISIILMIGAYISYVASETIQIAASAIVWMVVSALGILILSGVIVAGIYLYMLVIKIYDSKTKVIIAPESSQVYLHNLLTGDTKAAHLNPNPYSNGHWETPAPESMSIYMARLLKNKKAIEQQSLLIEGEVITQQRTIYDVVDNGLHFSLIGPTKAGKTTLANHIIDHLQADKTFICDPHTKYNVWSNRGEIIRDYDAIKMKVYEVYKEMETRYHPDSPMLFPSVLLVIDEYPKVSKKSEISEWITEISSEGRKVDIWLILLSQSDLVQDTSLNTAMRDNFTKITLTVSLTQENKAYIRHWDKSKELITLAGPYQRQMTVEERVIDEWLKVDKSDFELAVTEVTKIVYPSYGGYQRNKVKEIVKGLINES